MKYLLTLILIAGCASEKDDPTAALTGAAPAPTPNISTPPAVTEPTPKAAEPTDTPLPAPDQGAAGAPAPVPTPPPPAEITQDAGQVPDITMNLDGGVPEDASQEIADAGDPNDPPDAGDPADAGEPDSGPQDAGQDPPDAGPDASDSGPQDAGEPDAGGEDAGPADAGPDAGEDAGEPDSGPPPPPPCDPDFTEASGGDSNNDQVQVQVMDADNAPGTVTVNLTLHEEGDEDWIRSVAYTGQVPALRPMLRVEVSSTAEILFALPNTALYQKFSLPDENGWILFFEAGPHVAVGIEDSSNTMCDAEVRFEYWEWGYGLDPGSWPVTAYDNWETP